MPARPLQFPRPRPVPRTAGKARKWHLLCGSPGAPLLQNAVECSPLPGSQRAERRPAVRDERGTDLPREHREGCHVQRCSLGAAVSCPPLPSSQSLDASPGKDAPTGWSDGSTTTTEQTLDVKTRFCRRNSKESGVSGGPEVSVPAASACRRVCFRRGFRLRCVTLCTQPREALARLFCESRWFRCR